MIIVKSSRELDKMRRAGKLVASVMRDLERKVAPGVTTAELDRIAEDEIRHAGAIPAFKGYRGFPATLCTSVNSQVVHGIPGDDPLVEGEIVSLDLGARVDGYYGDMAVTLPVGAVSEEVEDLLFAGREALAAGIEAARPGAHLSDISHAVQQAAEAAGYSVVRDYTGHGIGRQLHEDPQILNFGPPGRGPVLKAGMVLAIEPMVNAGDYRVKTQSDGWTVVTADGELSVHFEHTVAVTADGPEVLTDSKRCLT
ncbi:MAG: type I methionyl aminopeptidase [Clostridia bacterium]